MSSFQKYRLLIAGSIVVVVGGLLLLWGYNEFKPLPDNTEFKTSYFSFSYPRSLEATEYAPGVVSIGADNGSSTDPLIEVVRYQSDPDVAAPANFDVFMKRQAAALCGADGAVESITCTQVGVTPFVSPSGVEAQKLNLTLIRKNLKSGTTSTSNFGPIYVFNTTDYTISKQEATTTPQDPFRFSAIFIYPSLPAFINQGTTSPQILQTVIDTFNLKK